MGQIGRGGIPMFKDKDNLHHNDVDVKRLSGVSKLDENSNNLIDSSHSPLVPNLDETTKFLSLFGAETFWFRTLNSKSGPKTSIDEQLTVKNALDRLQKTNNDGFNVYFIPNKVKGPSGADEYVTEIRAVFADLDGAPLQPVLDCGLLPHIIVETSPGKFHCYWLVKGLSKTEFKAYQLAIAKRFNSDTSVCNPSRIMRLPGFYHLKGEPFLSHIFQNNSDLPIHTPGEIVNGLQLDECFIRDAAGVQAERFELPDAINKGSRDNSIFQYICQLWEFGHSKEELFDMALSVNQNRCRPPLSENIVRAKVERITTTYKKGERNKLSLDRKKFNPNAWADDLIKHHKLIYDDGFVRFNGKHYEELKDNDLKYLVRESTKWLAKNSHTTEILESIKIKCGHNIPERDPIGLFCLKNGVFNYGKNEAGPHSDTYFLTHMVDVEYDKAATCPMWDTTFSQILPDEKSRLLLQKFAGYSLTSDFHHQVCLFLYGPGGNGKSTVIDVVSALVGEANRSALTLKDMSTHFILHKLRGKLANFTSEIGSAFVSSDDIFKRIVDGSELEADIKYKDPITFRSFAKLWIASNSILSSKDTSDGFMRRFLFLDFPVCFTNGGRERDLKIAEKIIKTELSGVLNWAIEGLRLLIEDGGFEPLPACHYELKKSTQLKINPRTSFFSLYVVEKPGGRVLLQNVVQSYNDYAKDMGRAPVSDATIIEDLTNRFGNRVEYRRFSKGMGFTNIELVTAEDSYELEGPDELASCRCQNELPF